MKKARQLIDTTQPAWVSVMYPIRPSDWPTFRGDQDEYVSHELVEFDSATKALAALNGGRYEDYDIITLDPADRGPRRAKAEQDYVAMVFSFLSVKDLKEFTRQVKRRFGHVRLVFDTTV